MSRPRGSKNSVQRQYKDYSGQKIGLLTVVERAYIENGASVYKCVCDCGKIKFISVGNLKDAKSCGCYRSNAVSPARTRKTCSKCKNTKSILEFNKNKSRKDGCSQFCKSCISVLDTYYRPRQKEHRNRRARERRKNNINFKIADTLRRRINSALRKGKKQNHTLDLIGCSIEYLISCLENKFLGGMSWENYGTVWEIDHIRPCASFDLSDINQQKECFNYKNLQPLFSRDNRIKSSMYNGRKHYYE